MGEACPLCGEVLPYKNHGFHNKPSDCPEFKEEKKKSSKKTTKKGKK